MRRCLLVLACVFSALALASSAHATPPGGNGELAITVSSSQDYGLRFVNWVTGETTRPTAPWITERARYAPGGAQLTYGKECISNPLSGCQGVAGPYGRYFAGVTSAETPTEVPYAPGFAGPSGSGLYRDGSSTHFPVDFAAGAFLGRIVWLRYDMDAGDMQLVSSTPDGGNRTIHLSTAISDRGGFKRQWMYEIAASPVDDKVYIRLGNESDTNPPRAKGIWEVDLSTNQARHVLPLQGTSAFRLADISPDGRYLLLVARNATGQPAIYTHDLVEGDSAQVLVPGTLDGLPYSGLPTFSPDGWNIAWVGATTGSPRSSKVWVAGLDEARKTVLAPRVVKQITTPPGGTLFDVWWIAWRPDAGAIKPAPFSATPSTNEPGRIDFRSEVVETPATLHWDFGNGRTENFAASVNVLYDKPGKYTVRHWFETSTEPVITGSTTKEVEIKAPTVTTSLSWDAGIEDNGRLPLGKTFDATLKVKANNDGVGKVSKLKFDEGVFTKLSVANVLKIESENQPPADGFELTPGQTREFPLKVTTLARGPVTITSGVKGTDAADQSVSSALSKITRVGFDFDFEFATTLKKADGEFGPIPEGGIKLEFDEDKQRPVPRDIRIDVTVKNTSGEAAKDVKLNLTALVKAATGRDPLAPNAIDFTAYKVDGKERVPLATANAKIDDVVLGDMLNAGTVHVLLEGRAQDKGLVEVRGIARGLNTEAPIRELSGNGSTDVRINQPLLLLIGGAESTPAPEVSKAGDRWSFAGFIKNTSPDQAVDVVILTEARGNVIGGPIDVVPESSHNPFGLRKVLAPGERVTLWRDFTSDKDGVTTADVKLHVTGKVPDETDPTKDRPVAKSEILVRDFKGRPATERHVAIDTSQPLPQPVEWTWSETGWIFTDSAARGFGRWVESKWQEVLGTRERQQLYLMHYWYIASKLYKALDQDEKQDVIEEMTGYIKQITDESESGIRAQVTSSIQTKLGEVSNAWDTGDVPYFAEATGGLLGESGPDALIEGQLARVAAGRYLQRFGKSAMVKVDTAQQATLAARIAAKGRKGFEPGDGVSLAHAFLHWGMDAALDARIRGYAKAKNIIITMRSRSAGSVARLEQGLLGKIESVKSKNVTRTDIDFLGFDETHLDTAMYKRMKNWDFYAAKLPPGMSDEQVRAIKARWWQRAKEYYKEAPKMYKYDLKSKIPVPPKNYGMNLVDNGYKELKDVPWEYRRFQNSKAGEGSLAGTWDGEPAYQPQVFHQGDGHPPGFRAFTGDMDMISITDSAGRILDKDRRMEVYKELAELGFEHPESLTWDNVGGRMDYINEFDAAQDGTDVLLAYRPDGKRVAVQLDTRKLLTTSATGNFLLLLGFGADFDAAPVTPNPSAAADFPNSVTEADAGAPDADEETIYTKPGGEQGATFTDDPGAALLRQNPDETFSRYDQDTKTWVPYSPPSGPVSQLPQTALTVALDAGETRLPIIEQPLLGASGAWFGAGQTVVVNPGGATEEVHTVRGLGSIILATPLRFSHGAGELVGVLPGSIARPPVVTPTPTPSVENPPPPIVVPAAPFTAQSAPTVTGRAVVGATLRAEPGTFSRAPQSVAYQWLRDGKPIAGATSATYKPAKALLRAKLSVRVTATHGGERTEQTSAAVTITWPVTITVKVSPRGSAKVGARPKLTVTVTTPGAKRAAGKLEIRVGAKRVKASVRRGSAKVTLPALRKGSTRISVSYDGGAAFERVTAKTITLRAR